MASSSPDRMEFVLRDFTGAQTVDHRCTAFQELRSYVKKSCRLNGPSSLSAGITGTCMSQALEMLMVFAERKRMFIDQVHEVVSHLDKNAEWQKLIPKVRGKLDELSSSIKSRSTTSTSTASSSHEDAPSPLSPSPALNDEGISARDSSWEDLSNLSLSEPAGHMVKLHKGLKDLCSLLLTTGSDTRRREKINEIYGSYLKEWERIFTEKDLHYVIAGLVSSGKTTLVNSLLALSNREKWKGDMLPSLALENTTAVTMLSYNHRTHEQIRARIDTVRLTEGQASGYACYAGPSSTMLSSMTELQAKIPSLLASLTETKDGFKRLVVEIPQQLDVLPALHEKTYGLDLCEVLVDTPGLDSPGLKQHLASILAEKCFLYCFIVNVESPSPFGNHGFELLQFLTRNVEVMFPPVIIFTKFRQLEETSKGETWQEANPGGLTKRLKDLVNLTLDKLEKAGVPHCPFFADVDALWASKECDQRHDRNKKIEAAHEGLSAFFTDLVSLGRSIASPLHQCRLVQLQNQTTQEIINEIHKEDGQRLLEGEDLDDLKKLGEKLKDDFSQNVDRYLNVHWTDGGLLQYQPPQPFNRDTCAISRVRAEFDKVFEDYKARHPNAQSKSQAVRCIVEETNKEILSLIANDLSKYEADALDKFKATLWKKIGTKDMDLAKHLDFSLWQYLVGGGLGYGAIISGIAAAADTAFAAGAATYFTGAAALAGVGVAAVGFVLCATFFAKDSWGGWTWDGGREASWGALLDACNKNGPKITAFVKEGFDKKVDEILKNIEDHRSVPRTVTSECQATKIQSSAKKGYKDLAKQLQEILKGKKERWLGKKGSTMELICKQVLDERQQKMQKTCRSSLNMGAMSE